MKITVVGTGYVGLVTGTCFAETGNDVTCVDIDANKVKKLSSGQITIYEPGLEKLFERNLKEERLSFTTNLEEGIRDAEVIFLALPTPPGADGAADLSFVLNVAVHLEGATVTVFDPEAMNNVKQLLGDKITYADHQYTCLENADALIIATEWSVFRTPDFHKISAALKNQAIFDGRNLFEVSRMKELGYHYESVGRIPAIL
ncbi:hypothetical protein HA402_012207 [Bradysia odoriphaga]|nr:hypothetical protein HA402_012207 [Bradysia odoriphaga]